MLPPSGSVADALAMVVPTATSSEKELEVIAIEEIGASLTSVIVIEMTSDT